jgi:hypothetical protein
MLFFLAAQALAQENDADDDMFWVGGGIAVRPHYMLDTFSLGGEVEADLLAKKGIVGFRLDLDLNATVLPDLAITTVAPDIVPINMVRPEWAMVEVEGESWVARGGIVNAGFGLEDWDDRALYLPTHGEYYAYSPGRMLGSEFGWTFGDDGPTLTVGGGLDLDWEAPTVEANVNIEGDSFATWSGIAAYPTEGMYAAVIGAEVYPAELVTIALGGMAGVVGTNSYATGSLYGVFLPEAIVNPTVRIDASFDPDHAFDPGVGGVGLSPWAVSAGGAIVPTDWMKVLVEAKVMGTEGDPAPGVYAALCFFTPDPAEDDDEGGDD